MRSASLPLLLYISMLMYSYFVAFFFRNAPCPLSDVGTDGAPNGIVYSSVRAI